METKQTDGTTEVINWDWSFTTRPVVVVHPKSVDDIVAIMKDREKYPAPVRAVGSHHAATGCTGADGGTLLVMTEMNKILDIGKDTVTTQAGAFWIDVGQELAKHELQHYVNLEIGMLTMGTAAVCGTKDSAFVGEYGQCNSYAIRIKMVTASGELLEIDESDPELLRFARSSYGLMGIVYEVTFRVRRLSAMIIRHKRYTLEEFCKELPALQKTGESIFMYITPHINRVTVEFRKYGDELANTKGQWKWQLRNYFWKQIAPRVGWFCSNWLPRPVRFWPVNLLNRFQTFVMETAMKGPTRATDQTIRFAPMGEKHSLYMFSIWAFPEKDWPRIIQEYFQFNLDYSKKHGYRCNMLNVGYRIFQDQSSYFSYCDDGNVMTCDPVGSGDAGWNDYLDAYNQWCIERGGRPLFNQSRRLTPELARRAYGKKLDVFNELRRKYDPDNRLLNKFFRGIFEPALAERSVETPPVQRQQQATRAPVRKAAD
jgi:FAD/FMN-containing dehydrogenase